MNNDVNKEYPNKIRRMNDINVDIIVPDQVFFGLIEGKIKGPFIYLPKI